MNDTDKFMQEEFMPFYKRVYDVFKQNHHMFYSVLDSLLSGTKNHMGMRLRTDESILGNYTLHFDGANISHLEIGTLSSEIHTPFGILRPYVIVEKSIVEEMIRDEPNFIQDPFSTKMKYAHHFTIKFLQ